MIHDHKFYEMQGALAATGNLTDAELVELERHASACASCKECIAEMGEMSREFFLMQAQRMRSRRRPEGMQERFLDRAESAGILVRRSACTSFDPRFARAGASAVLLAIAFALSARILSVPSMERGTETNAPVFLAQTAAPNLVGERAARMVRTGKVQSRRRSTARLRVVSISSGRGITEDRASSLKPDSQFANQTVLDKGVPVATRASFTNAYHVPSFFGHKEDGESEERAFHLDIKLASLTDTPQSFNAGAERASLKFSFPAFHLDPNRVW